MAMMPIKTTIGCNVFVRYNIAVVRGRGDGFHLVGLVNVVFVKADAALFSCGARDSKRRCACGGSRTCFLVLILRQ